MAARGLAIGGLGLNGRTSRSRKVSARRCMPTVRSQHFDDQHEFAELAHGLWDVLKSPDFTADALQKTLPDTRAFYDANKGLRIIVVACAYWAEAWIHSPTVRRACIHTSFLERGVTFEWDSAQQVGRLLTEDNWPEDLDPLKFE